MLSETVFAKSASIITESQLQLHSFRMRLLSSMNCFIGQGSIVWAFHCFFMELSSLKWVVSHLFKDVLWPMYVLVVILFITRITMFFWTRKLKNYIGDMSLDFKGALFLEYPACTTYLRIYISFFIRRIVTMITAYSYLTQEMKRCVYFLNIIIYASIYVHF